MTRPDTWTRRAAVTALAAAFAGATILGLGPAGVASAEPVEPSPDGRPPRDLLQVEVLNVAHRAEVRGATEPPPENTLAAIDAAIEAGADAIELDVTLTADDELVLMHDRSLNRTTNATAVFGPGTHNTVDRTLAELKTLTAGTFEGEAQEIPTFAEALDAIRGRVGLLIDVKYDHSDTPITPLIAAELEAQPGFDEWGPDTVSFGSYGWTVLQEARTLLPDLELTFIMNYLCVLPNGVIAAGDLPPGRAEGIPGITPLSTTISQFTQALVDGGIDTVGIFALSTYKGTTASCADNDFTATDVDRFATAGIRFAQNAETAPAMTALVDRGVRAILTDYTDVLATVLPPPGAPTDVTAGGYDQNALVSWTAPDPHRGSRRLGYTVTVEPGGQTIEVGPDETELNVVDLDNGTEYTFTVTARNFAGSGPAASTTATPRNFSDDYVIWLYETFIGRSPSVADLQYWTAGLDYGVAPSTVSRPIRLSADATAHRDIRGTYRDWLGRSVDSGSLAYWADQLRSGTPRWKFEANVLGSAELRSQAGGTDAAWVQRVFQLTLGRNAGASDVTYYTGRLAAGTGRGTLAAQIRHSPEGAGAAVRAAYAELLGAPVAGAPTFDSLVAVQRSTRDIRQVEITIAGSRAAYDAHTPDEWGPPYPDYPPR